ncbi:MAG: IS630 family transposase [Myxococcota bacterium]
MLLTIESACAALSNEPTTGGPVSAGRAADAASDPALPSQALDAPQREPRRSTPHRVAPGPKPKTIELLPAERKRLELLARSRTGSAESAYRAQIILTLAEAPNVSAAAKKLGFSRNTITLWRDRFLDRGELGLKTLSIPGRMPTISDIARVNLIGMACGTPADFGVLARTTWTHESLHEAYMAHHPTLEAISVSTIQRILHNADLKPHRLRLWLHSPDPEFRRKVNEVCALYKEVPEGALVLCFDEKTGMQALGRRHAAVLPSPRLQGRKEFEYVRHGTRSLLATFNPHTGEVFAQVRSTRTAEDLLAFMEALAAHHPTGDIHIIWDNLNIHHEGKDKRWTEFNEKHGNRFHFHDTPIHASWVNQIEIFFGIFSKRVLKHADFGSVEALEKASVAFIEHWNRTEKHPFAWKFKGYPLVSSS